MGSGSGKACSRQTSLSRSEARRVLCEDARDLTAPRRNPVRNPVEGEHARQVSHSFAYMAKGRDVTASSAG